MSLSAKVPRLMVSGVSSGCGKTTVTCGLLRALVRRGLKVQACKVGPDYLDPTFHRQVLGVSSRNLDLFLGGEALARQLLVEGGEQSDITVIEGVMGHYDGIACGDEASSYAVARATNTPVVLVADARGRALSVAAEILGFVRLRNPSQIRGVVLNRVSASYYPMLKQTIETETGVAVLGFLPQLDEVHLESRHLGLVDAAEVPDIQQRLDVLADTLAKTVDVDALLALSKEAPALSNIPRELPRPCKGSPVIAVARDEAFSFYYDDTLRLFEKLGARLRFFSPLRDNQLPEGSCGLYLGGGYPELHARELSESLAMLTAIRDAIARGLPTIAECGGFLYLHQTLEDEQGIAWPMVGVVAGQGRRARRLGTFGYATLSARIDNVLCHAGETLPAHEFHYWQSDTPGDAFHAQKPHSMRGWECVVATESLYAGFPHLYLCGSPEAARRFVETCAAFGQCEGRG